MIIIRSCIALKEIADHIGRHCSTVSRVVHLQFEFTDLHLIGHDYGTDNILVRKSGKGKASLLI